MKKKLQYTPILTNMLIKQNLINKSNQTQFNREDNEKLCIENYLKSKSKSSLAKSFDTIYLQTKQIQNKSFDMTHISEMNKIRRQNHNKYIEQIEYYHRYCQKLSRDSRFMHACPLKQQIQKMMVEKKDEIVKKCQKESEQMMSEFYQQIKNSDVQDYIVDQTYLSIQQVRLQFMRYLNQFLNYPQQSVQYELLQLTNLIQVQPPENIHEIQTSQVQSYLQQFHEISQNCINQLNDLKQQQAVMSIDSSLDEVIMLQSKIIKTIESCSEPITLQILLNFCWELQKRVFVRKTNPDLLKNSLIRNRNAFGKLIDSDKKIVQQNEALKIQYFELINLFARQLQELNNVKQLDTVLIDYLVKIQIKGKDQQNYKYIDALDDEISDDFDTEEQTQDQEPPEPPQQEMEQQPKIEPLPYLYSPIPPASPVKPKESPKQDPQTQQEKQPSPLPKLSSSISNVIQNSQTSLVKQESITNSFEQNGFENVQRQNSLDENLFHSVSLKKKLQDLADTLIWHPEIINNNKTGNELQKLFLQFRFEISLNERKVLAKRIKILQQEEKEAVQERMNRIKSKYSVAQVSRVIELFTEFELKQLQDPASPFIFAQETYLGISEQLNNQNQIQNFSTGCIQQHFEAQQAILLKIEENQKQFKNPQVKTIRRLQKIETELQNILEAENQEKNRKTLIKCIQSLRKNTTIKLLNVFQLDQTKIFLLDLVKTNLLSPQINEIINQLKLIKNRKAQSKTEILSQFVINEKQKYNLLQNEKEISSFLKQFEEYIKLREGVLEEIKEFVQYD
ncbi:Hypothetical_protein [Hexamita inflata]|uniref:Hypothetical_protein n=1 Tax=Hexamita inflata TaxID=28002 RepID=A0AA86TK36_9EUKA|nr:Hypothetical protein HINF_LOCUS7425 [Hexamita inflata]CAI9928485.1 Hypothetical protein HINF_LOCUS16130 [Hexamita inflata]